MIVCVWLCAYWLYIHTSLQAFSSCRSSARHLATLNKGKFGQLKINLVFAEKNVKLKKGERRIKQTAMWRAEGENMSLYNIQHLQRPIVLLYNTYLITWGQQNQVLNITLIYYYPFSSSVNLWANKLHSFNSFIYGHIAVVNAPFSSVFGLHQLQYLVSYPLNGLLFTRYSY